MPCYHPLQAWRTKSGDVVLSKEPVDGQFLRLPCGNCIGCRTNRAQAWALRCHLELHGHASAVFATLTYDDDHKPLTLDKRHVSAYIKKLRKEWPNKLRFFASGEYGEHTNRPHYHAILYGANELQAARLETAWGKGHVRIEGATPANIAYTAGYCSKKLGYRRTSHERVDPTTGEVYQWQPPFILMSRNPGIGSGYRATQYLRQWRLFTVNNGHKQAVPRYFKDAWRKLATLEETEALAEEIRQLNLTPLTREQLNAAELYAVQRHKMAGEKRYL